MFRLKPKEPTVDPLHFKDGQHVFYLQRQMRVFFDKIVKIDGRIKLEDITKSVKSETCDARHTNEYYYGRCHLCLYEDVPTGDKEVYLIVNGESRHIGDIERGLWVGKYSFHRTKFYKFKLIQEKRTMANKLMALVRLNKNQRKLAKAGVYDENGNLTVDGQEVLMNLLAKDYEAKLVELVKDWKDTKKDKSDDEE